MDISITEYFFKVHKPSANQGKARLRGLYRIISSKTISPHERSNPTTDDVELLRS